MRTVTSQIVANRDEISRLLADFSPSPGAQADELNDAWNHCLLPRQIWSATATVGNNESIRRSERVQRIYLGTG